MRTSVMRFGSVFLFALNVACAPTPPAPAVDLRDAGIQALKDADAAWTKAVGEKDLEKWMSFYAADASVFAPGVSVAAGTDAIRALLTPLLKDQNFALSFAPTRVEADKAGELGYSQGAYRQTLTDPKTGKPFTEKGSSSRSIGSRLTEAGKPWSISGTPIRRSPNPGSRIFVGSRSVVRPANVSR